MRLKCNEWLQDPASVQIPDSDSLQADACRPSYKADACRPSYKYDSHTRLSLRLRIRCAPAACRAPTNGRQLH